MRVMVVARRFSGFADALANEDWQPKGVPAIGRLLEGIAAHPDLELLTVFTCKDAYEGRFRRARRMTLDPLGQVLVLPWSPRPLLARLRLDGILRELSHLVRCLWLYFRFRPDVTYFTNANFLIAGTFARLGLGRVVLRFLGLHPEQKRLATARGGLQRWFYQAPFDRVICTRDGSGGNAYLPRLLNPRTPCGILLNGVDFSHADADAVARLKQEHGLENCTVITFVGRLESHKGCREFVEAVLETFQGNDHRAAAIVLGDGNLRGELEALIAAAPEGKRVMLLGSVPQRWVRAWLDLTSIYVPINKFGSLSNANLEAIAAGKCVVVLEKELATYTDEETEEILPPGSVIRIPRENIAGELAAILRRLLQNPDEISAVAARARAVAAEKFQSWDQRVDQEITLLQG